MRFSSGDIQYIQLNKPLNSAKIVQKKDFFKKSLNERSLLATAIKIHGILEEMIYGDINGLFYAENIFIYHLELQPVQKWSGRKEIDGDKYSKNSLILLVKEQ